jgi:hypothetical protein
MPRGSTSEDETSYSSSFSSSVFLERYRPNSRTSYEYDDEDDFMRELQWVIQTTDAHFDPVI